MRDVGGKPCSGGSFASPQGAGVHWLPAGGYQRRGGVRFRRGAPVTINYYNKSHRQEQYLIHALKCSGFHLTIINVCPPLVVPALERHQP